MTPEDERDYGEIEDGSSHERQYEHGHLKTRGTGLEYNVRQRGKYYPIMIFFFNFNIKYYLNISLLT